MTSAKSALASACAVLVLGSCSPPAEVQPEARPNILWIVWDTVRADRLGLYGHDRDTTPALERWAITFKPWETKGGQNDFLLKGKRKAAKWLCHLRFTVMC